MKTVKAILSYVDHRPWALPRAQWTYYQEWNRALFLHWKVPERQLSKLVPTPLLLDTYNNEAWVTLVAFTMERIRPKGLPAVPFLSNFHEVNIRTYVRSGDKPGVYFLSIEASKSLSAYTARMLSGLPYEPATILRQGEAFQRYASTNTNRHFHLDASFTIGKKELNKSALDLFLTEKYCLYMEKEGSLFRYDIHHQPWELLQIEQINLDINYRVGELDILEKPDLVHYSDGVKVIAWDKVLAGT
ncbi:DUF2071 domain-containing protein [Flavihumibacter rivuli]|uniref:YqjF family protein n=1 Tax=Flavihumibacter rivuli TaxID=2838156 RepID=UPI001BDF6103|nr:DUF2071 domain-containing protein [Flavihumibacter rivuli]ULQ57122.1 DUF2071 domain-containing protein [Flavihumibacter rivuli]